MTIQTGLMTVIAIMCFASSANWVASGALPAAAANAGFGLGYLGLAWLFA